jgi:hypothetical protein
VVQSAAHGKSRHAGRENPSTSWPGPFHTVIDSPADCGETGPDD